MVSFSAASYRDLFAGHGIISEDDILGFCAGGELVDTGSISTVWRLSLGDSRFYAKRYQYSSPSWKHMLFHRGRWEKWSYSKLKEIGIPCPEIVSFCEKTGRGGFYWCILITKEIPNACNLQDLFVSGKAPDELRMRIMEKLGHLVGTMHGRDFYHRDLKLRNVIWENTGGDEIHLYFGDCPRGRKGWFFFRDPFYDMLALYRHCRLVCTDSEWRTLLEAYVTRTGLPAGKLEQKIRCEWEKKAKNSP